MRIKRLEIHGFKSFAERTVLRFGDGITGVVGPNGCGKSNIIDAIRWCMGEMSPKHLRGRGMQDIIFAGSDTRGPLGMAEVTLTFENNGVAPPTYADYAEIAITRRLHRDGTSEYAINQAPARLRDIVDLFLGTGAGTRAYSIIEQGRIGFIVNSRPEDRRALLEELAGITRYKSRKTAALRRMESTEQNLMRVGDVVAELERQLRSLSRQAKKAEKYKRLKDQARDLDLPRAAIDWLRLNVHGKELCARVHESKLNVADEENSADAAQAAVDAERLRLGAEEQNLHARQDESAKVELELASLGRDLEHWRTQAADVKKRVLAAEDEIASAAAQSSTLSAEETELRQWLSENERQVDEKRSELAGAQAATAESKQKSAELERHIEKQRLEAMEHMHEAVRHRTRGVTLLRQREDATRRASALSEQRQNEAARRDEAKLCHADGTQARVAGEAGCERLRRELGGATTRLGGLAEAVAGLEMDLTKRRDELTERRSRLTSLKEVASTGEGMPDGVRAILAARSSQKTAVSSTAPVDSGAPSDQDDADVRQRVAGLVNAVVADTLVVEQDHERAVEAVLGERLHYLVMGSEDVCLDAVGLLARSDGGRGGFIPATLVAAAGGGVVATTGVDDLTRSWQCLADLVTEVGENAAIVEHLLGDVYFFATAAAAAAAAAEARNAGWQSHRGRSLFVSADGVVVDIAGVVIGGSGNEGGVLARQRQIRMLSKLVEQLADEVKAAAEKLNRRLAERSDSEGLARRLDDELRAAELSLANLRKDEEAALQNVERCAEREQTSALEQEQIEREIKTIDEHVAESEAQTQSCEKSKEHSEAALEELRQQLAKANTVHQANVDSLTHLRVEGAGREEKLKSKSETLKRVVHARQEFAGRLNRGQGVVTEGEGISVELTEKISTGEQRAASVSTRVDAMHKDLQTARERYELEQATVTKLETTLKSQRESLNGLRKGMHNAQLELRELEMQREKLDAMVRERHDINLIDIVGEFHLRPVYTAAEEELRLEVEEKIRALGGINLTAIDDYAEVQSRLEFLKTQQDDLNEALAALRSAISRINRLSRRRFKDAFTAVNTTFQELFPRLFHGGEARLELTDADDILEAGVEIIAMPPGKKLQNVSLLSGGEKALTATALIFSFFLVKPSPFCVLDEVDAPLDEANVTRFNELLREVSRISQFIIITHNKTTMSRTDRLYGITMEEPGMSKVVSVDLDDDQAAA